MFSCRFLGLALLVLGRNGLVFASRALKALAWASRDCLAKPMCSASADRNATITLSASRSVFAALALAQSSSILSSV